MLRYAVMLLLVRIHALVGSAHQLVKIFPGYHSANQAVYQKLAAIFPAEHPPHFLFSDEREYPPYFSQPEGFQVIKLVMDSGMVIPEFIRIQ